MKRCGKYFAWSGRLVDQAFQDRLEEGTIRCYLTHDEVVGFCHQRPKGLLDPAPEAMHRTPLSAPPP